MANQEIITRYKTLATELWEQFLSGARLDPVSYSVGGDVLDAAWSSDPDGIYIAYFAIRLFELWDDMLEELCAGLDAPKLGGAANRFEWLLSQGYVEPSAVKWSKLRNQWVHEGIQPSRAELDLLQSSFVDSINGFRRATTRP